ncbi:hypothetical protein ACFWZ2_23145 [Streptomyces sp. NPDC059002]|uniref:hypothetical protein n=1 Tax=Streptomyces sp. NPDC059002 TaxID=3346690 RepID=UPI003681AC02
MPPRDATPAPRGGEGPAPPAGARAHRLLLAVCAVFALLSLALVPPTLPLGWDELVYASRFSSHAPATPFSAPRTRGVPFLIAPVASWSDSVVLLRLWLTLLSTAALYLGFRPWLRAAHRPSAAAVAAGLYGCLWVALFYASAAMPNHYTAMGAVGAVGLFLRARPTAATYAGIAAWLALATLMRPNDGAAVAAPLLLAALLVRAWRGRGRVLAVLGGLGAGALPWIVEAYVRFGGVRERLARASEVQGDLRPLLSFVHHLTVLDGPLLCRPCDGDGIRLVPAQWWVLLPLLVAAGLWTLRRRAPDVLPAHALALGTALSVALPYLLLVPYAAPRFLLPAHALLAPTAATGLLAVAGLARTPGRRRAAGVVLPAVLALALTGHLVAQLLLVHGNSRIQSGARDDWARVAEVLNAHGVGGGRTKNGGRDGSGAPPRCVLRGNTSVIPIAYAARCDPAGHDDPRRPSALVLREAAPPRWARDWPRHVVPHTYAPGWVVHVRPGTPIAPDIRNSPPGVRS